MNNLFKKIVLSPKEAKTFITKAHNPRIINASQSFPLFNDPIDKYFKEERIPQSTFLDIKDVSRKSPFPNMMPFEDEFR